MPRPVDGIAPIPRFAKQTEADRFYLSEAFRERNNSDDPKARLVSQSGVGAVIASKEGEVARSANVLPPVLAAAYNVSGRLVDDQDRYFVIEHAERAAIFQAMASGRNLAGATIYCTRFPCSDCARAIIWAGIERAVVPSGFAGEDRWIGAQRAALQMFRDAGITVRYLPPL